MICADTSVWVHFLEGNDRLAVKVLEDSLAGQRIYVSPPVLSEILSFPALETKDRELVLRLPLMGIRAGYWERVGDLRRKVLSGGMKARFADCLIAQNCIDENMPLLTLDGDYRHFVPLGLKILKI